MTVYMYMYNVYKPYKFNETFLDELAVMDVNGDGTSDVVGFLNNGSLFCQLGSSSGNFSPCEQAFRLISVCFSTLICQYMYIVRLHLYMHKEIGPR